MRFLSGAKAFSYAPNSRRTSRSSKPLALRTCVEKLRRTPAGPHLLRRRGRQRQQGLRLPLGLLRLPCTGWPAGHRAINSAVIALAVGVYLLTPRQVACRVLWFRECRVRDRGSERTRLCKACEWCRSYL